MFECAKCHAHEDEIKFLREQVKTLTDKVLALASPATYSMIAGSTAADGFFGDGKDQYVGFDTFGQRILMQKEADETEGSLQR